MRCPVISEGFVRIGDVDIHVSSILFDSGGLCDSMISKRLVDANRREWQPYLKRIRTSVKLGGTKAQQDVNEQLTLSLKVIDFNLQKHTATFKAHVWDMEELDMIVGLYDIIDKFSDLFIQFITNGVKEHLRRKDSDQRSLNSLHVETVIDIESSMAPGEMIRWCNGDDNGAPENEECPDPCSFTAPLYYMETGHEEALKTNFSLFETHVQPDFLAHPGVRELLESDLPVDFCSQGADRSSWFPTARAGV